jgi:AcrR family transcriptional regulator
MNQEKPLDRRIQKTRKLLMNSLVELTLQKGFEKVTIQDIIDHANVGRSTFYAHFESKEHLLFSGFRGLTSGLALKTDKSMNESISSFFRQLYEHVVENKPLAKAMIGKSGGNLIIRHLQEALSQYFESYLKKTSNNLGQSKLKSEAASGALIAMLSWWLEDESDISTAFMIQQSEEICKKIIG